MPGQSELNLVINEMHALLWPDLIVLCGGITEEPEKFMDKLHCEARLCVGTLRSEAGIVGAALATTLSAARPEQDRVRNGAASLAARGMRVTACATASHAVASPPTPIRRNADRASRRRFRDARSS